MLSRRWKENEGEYAPNFLSMASLATKGLRCSSCFGEKVFDGNKEIGRFEDSL